MLGVYKLINTFKRNAQKSFEENIAQSSTEKPKEGQDKTKFFIYLKL